MKTINKAAKEFAESEIMETYDSIIEELKRISFIYGAKFAQEWISVEDELPESYDWVLAKSDVGDFYISNFNSNKFNVNMPFEVKITHWRPIERK